MKINRFKNIIVKSNLPKADYVVNPYIGCSFGCIYCYAKSIVNRFFGIDKRWGSFSFEKDYVNFDENLDNEILRLLIKKKKLKILLVRIKRVVYTFSV